MITPADESIMSSFLMNTGSYGADPKFLSAEDYHSQVSSASAMSTAGYMPHGDYYAQHAAAGGYHPGMYHGAANMGLNSQQALAASGYSREQMAAYGNYYQNSGVSPHQQQMLHQQMLAASGGHLSPLNPGAASHLTGGHRSPVSSPQPQAHNLANNVGLNHGAGHDGNGNSLCGSGGNGGGSGDGDGYPSPQHSNVVSQPQLTPGGGGGGDGMSSDCSDDESSPSSNRQMPVVYPWMKKIHVGGVGKNQFHSALTHFDGSDI